MKYKGAIFDMDGLMLDTERLHCEFWIKAAAEYGYTLRMQDLIAARGMSGETALRHFKACYGEDFDYKTIHARRNELFFAYCDEVGVQKKKGVGELLACLKERGLRLALATSNIPAHSETELRRAGLWDFFDARVYGPMVAHSKPAPDIFLLACEKLALAPQDCFVFEDSTNGIKAAAAAGCAPVMIPDLLPADEEMRALAMTVQPDLLAVRDYLLAHELV